MEKHNFGLLKTTNGAPTAPFISMSIPSDAIRLNNCESLPILGPIFGDFGPLK